MTDTLIGKCVNVLDSGFVELQDMLPHPATGISADNAIVAAARVSFLGESKGAEPDKKLIHYLMRNRHSSPFEMVEFKFRVRCPLITYWQWIRHRTFHYQSINSQSGRYTEFEENEFYVPDVWRKQAKSNKQASEGTLEGADGEELTRDLIAYYAQGYTLYEKALAKGVAREMARLFLPGFAVYYTWIVKVDLKNLFDFLQLRMAQDAQYEIRVFAETIYHEFVKPAVPVASEAWEKYILNPPNL